MSNPRETEQIRKFENDEVAQHYFEVLRTLISKPVSYTHLFSLLKTITKFLKESLFYS